MPTPTDEELDGFLSLFEGDITAAHAALDRHVKEKSATQSIQSKNHPYAQNEMVISVHNVSKEYNLAKQHVKALSGVTFDIHKGEFIAITGTSGSGKSTLLQIIGCLDKPTSGEVIVNSQNITKLNDPSLSELRKKTFGFIFQSFYLQPFLHLDDNVAVPAMFTSMKKDVIVSRVALLLQQVGLSDRKNHLPKELSGGQIQRAAIARALMNMPSIILADEPTGNLDSTNSQSIIDLFKTIREKLGTTIVIVTHDINIAQQADRIIKLKDGVVI